VEKEGGGKGGINVQKQPFSDSVLLLHVARIPEKNFIPKLSNCRSIKPESENGHFCTLLESDKNVEGDHAQSQL